MVELLLVIAIAGVLVWFFGTLPIPADLRGALLRARSLVAAGPRDSVGPLGIRERIGRTERVEYVRGLGQLNLAASSVHAGARHMLAPVLVYRATSPAVQHVVLVHGRRGVHRARRLAAPPGRPVSPVVVDPGPIQAETTVP